MQMVESGVRIRRRRFRNDSDARLALGLVAWSACVLLVGPGCNSLRFDFANVPVKVLHGRDIRTIQERNAFFFRLGTEKVDISTKCPYGIAALEENTTGIDGFLAAITLGIYTPRSVVYYCWARPAGAQQ